MLSVCVSPLTRALEHAGSVLLCSVSPRGSVHPFLSLPLAPLVTEGDRAPEAG